MIRKTMRVRIRKYAVRTSKVEFRYMVTTYWFLFIPVYIAERYMEAA